jgi:NhaP-type Na+/H+ or K+/H+ antiporter
MAGRIISTLALAAILGVLSGFVWSALLRRVRSLENSAFTTPAFVFILFGCVELLGFSGYIAALAFGATLGNIESFHSYPGLKRYLPAEPISMNEPERVFLGEVVFLLKTFFFVYVGLSVDLGNAQVIWIGCTATAIIFAVRIPAVFFSLERRTPRRDMSFLAAMAPKGLAAIVLASIPVQNHIPAGETIRAVVNVVVFASITLTSILAFLIERTPVGNAFHRIFSAYGKPLEEPLSGTALPEPAEPSEPADDSANTSAPQASSALAAAAAPDSR